MDTHLIGFTTVDKDGIAGTFDVMYSHPAGFTSPDKQRGLCLSFCHFNQYKIFRL